MMEPFAPRLLRPVGRPPGVYFRPGYSNHTAVVELLAGGNAATFTGVVLEASHNSRHQDLLSEVLARKAEAVLDTEMMELATPAGFAQREARHLPWAAAGPHTVGTFGLPSARQGLVERIVSCIGSRSFTAVLAPAHLLSRGIEDPWFAVDQELTHLLREQLDRAGLGDLPIYYPLAVPTRIFTDIGQRGALRTALSTLPIDAVWLRVYPFGGRSGPTSVRRLIEACPDLHHPTRPLVAERVGVEGLALLAFGAVGAIGSGIATGEHFDAARLQRAPQKSGKRFGPRRRLYLPELQAYLPIDKAEKFFEVRGMKSLCACKDEGCCRRGLDDMLRDPRGHFMRQRLREVASLSRIPETLRPPRYLQDVLWRASNKMLRATKVEKSLASAQRRLEGLLLALSDLERQGEITSFSAVPQGRRLEFRKGA
jgi:hypothetical protein